MWTTDATHSELLGRIAAHVAPIMRSTRHARWWRIEWEPGTTTGAIVSSKANEKMRIGFEVKKGWK